MKAILYENYGSPDVLRVESVDTPDPNPGEVRIAVSASSVNRTDCAMLRARPFIMRFITGLVRPKRPILGTAFAGTVDVVGAQVTGFAVGDRVFGFHDGGVSSYAEYTCIPTARALAMQPPGASHNDCAAGIEGLHYARNFVNKVAIRDGQTALVNGATSAIGSAAVQLLHHRGVRVTGVCRGEHAELVSRIGASQVIDYTREDFTQIDQRFDFVFDAVGKSSFGKCRRILAPRGTYISSELGFLLQNVFYSLATPIFGRRRVKFPLPANEQESVNLLAEMLGDGTFVSVIDRCYGLLETAEAFRYVERGEKIGNVLITPTAGNSANPA